MSEDDRAKQLAAAEQALADYVAGLPPEMQKKAQEIQENLIRDSKTNPMGMMGAILIQLNRLQCDLLDCVEQLHTLADQPMADASPVLNKIMRK